MTRELLMGLILALMAALTMCGCIVATRRDWDYVMKGNESIGYMRGLSDCAELVRKRQ